MEKKTRNTLIISVIALALVLIGVTYAYFSARITGLESASTLSLSAGRMSIAYSEDDNEVSMSNIYPKSEPWITKTITLTGTNTTDQEMKYKIGLNVTENTFATNDLTYDFTLISSNGTAIATKNNQPINGTGQVQFGVGTFTIANNDSHNYRLDIYFKDNGLDQNDSQGAVFNAKIYVAEKTPGVYESAATLITRVCTETTGCDEGNNMNGLVKITHDTTQNANFTATEYRYRGSNPNNWAYFNCSNNLNPTSATCEKWRIIGLFDGIVKIVKSDSIGSFSWDKSSNDDAGNHGWGIDQWGESDTYEGADLMRELNSRGEYANAGYLSSSLSANANWYASNDINNSPAIGNFNYNYVLKSSSYNMVDNATWYLGGIYHSFIRSLENSYLLERNGAYKYCDSTYQYCTDSVTRTASWTGRVGLIYATDYGYASGNSACATNLLASYGTPCDLNWMSNYGWTISRRHDSMASSDAYIVYSNNLLSYTSTMHTGNVRPSVYLVSGIQMKAIDPDDTVNLPGSENNPYIFK